MTTEEKAALVAFIEGRLNQHATLLPLEVYSRFQEEAYRIALATLTADPVVAPDGWQLVPVEPTEDMKDAYYEHSIAPISRLSIIGYRAMLAAAPTP